MLGQETLDALNVPIRTGGADRREPRAVSLDAARLGQRYVFVNVPQFKLRRTTAARNRSR